jgi:hypothetical protein
LRTTIWTKIASELLYESLVLRFGPYASWQKVHTPGYGKDDEYREFCSVFAKAIGANSGDAVQHQIAFALPLPPGARRTWEAGQARVYVLNIAMAFYAGFITNSDFPDILGIADKGEPLAA